MTQFVEYIYQGIEYSRLPANNHVDNWFCLNCGRAGKVKAFYKSTLRTRARAHLNCRCPKR